MSAAVDASALDSVRSTYLFYSNPASFSSLLGSRVAHGPLKVDALASDRSMPLWPSERLKLELVRTKHYNITIYKPIRPQTSAIPSRACYSGWAAAVAVAVVPRTTTTSSKTSIIAKALPLPPPHRGGHRSLVSLNASRCYLRSARFVTSRTESTGHDSGFSVISDHTYRSGTNQTQ